MKALYRVKVVIDHVARFEECNGEPRPLTETEYMENHYRACPNPDHAGAPSHTDPPNTGLGVCDLCGPRFADVSYERYRAYYGNPERHIYLGVMVEKLMLPVGNWAPAASLWNIDCMRDNPEAQSRYRNCWYSPERVPELPGYLKEVALEVLGEAGYRA